MNSYSKNIHKIEDCLNNLQGKEYISESTVNFFRDIIRAQYKIKEQLDSEEISFTLTEDEIKERLQNGTPLISWDDLPLKESHLEELFQKICEVIKRNKKSGGEEIQRLIDAESGGDLELNTLVEKLFYHDSTYFHSLSKELEIAEDLLVFVSLNLAKPFFEVVAEEVSDKVVETSWFKHYCPVCGAGAQMAKLEKEVGKKILYCLLCGSEWRFMRIKCPFCCNEEQKSMKFLEEEKSPYRIDICEQCKRYIKTLNERKGGDEKREFIPSVEDIATMYLDIVAEKEGYERSWFFPPSVDELKADGKRKTLH